MIELMLHIDKSKAKILAKTGTVEGEHDTNGMACGEGVWISDKGDQTYEGTWKDGLPHGFGICTRPTYMYQRYEGEWMNGKQHKMQTLYQ